MTVLDHFTINGVVNQPGYGTIGVSFTQGMNYTVPNNTYIIHFLPSALIASGTVTMPSAPNDGQIIKLVFHQTVTLLTITGNTGQSMVGNSGLGVGNSGFSFQFNLVASVLAANTWYRIY